MTLQARMITPDMTLLVADYSGLMSNQLVKALNEAFNSFRLPSTIRFSADTDHRHNYDTNRQIGLILTLNLADLPEATTTALLRALHGVFQDDTLVHYSDLRAETAVCTYRLGKDRKLSVRQHVAREQQHPPTTSQLPTPATTNVASRWSKSLKVSWEFPCVVAF